MLLPKALRGLVLPFPGFWRRCLAFLLWLANPPLPSLPPQSCEIPMLPHSERTYKGVEDKSILNWSHNHRPFPKYCHFCSFWVDMDFKKNTIQPGVTFIKKKWDIEAMGIICDRLEKIPRFLASKFKACMPSPTLMHLILWAIVAAQR